MTPIKYFVALCFTAVGLVSLSSHDMATPGWFTAAGVWFIAAQLGDK